MANGDLFYRRMGSGPLLVFLHPVGLDGSFWGDLPNLCAKTHTVVCADLSGHGGSFAASRPGRMKDYVADASALLDGLKSGPAILLGLSFGGMIAQQLAMERPEHVAALILCACPGRIPMASRDAILQRGRDAEKGGMEAVIQSTLDRWFTPGFLGSEAVERVRRRLLTDSVSNWAAAWEAVSEHDALDRLAGFRKAALVVGGEKDAATSVEAKRALAAAIPESRLVLLPDAPHMMQIECADRFAQTVGGFLEELRVRR
jgi:3-oxoadipate enol-lactonase